MIHIEHCLKNSNGFLYAVIIFKLSTLEPKREDLHKHKSRKTSQGEIHLTISCFLSFTQVSCLHIVAILRPSSCKDVVLVKIQVLLLSCRIDIVITKPCFGLYNHHHFKMRFDFKKARQFGLLHHAQTNYYMGCWNFFFFFFIF